MKPRFRKPLLFATLAVVLLLAWFAPDPADQRGVSRVAVVAPSGDSKASGRSQVGTRVTAFADLRENTQSTLSATLPEREALGKARRDIFGYQTWEPPPPPVKTTPVPLASPKPPPNPYRFAGKTVQEGQTHIYLTRGDYPVQVKVGDVLDGTYRVDTIGDTGIAVTYLPLDYQERIAIPPRGLSAQGATVPPGASVLAPPRPRVMTPPLAPQIPARAPVLTR